MSQALENPFDCYAAIGKWLSDEVPEPWISITVYFEIIEIDDVSKEQIDYVPDKKPGSVKQFCIDDMGFADCFFRLAHITSTIEKGFFRKCKFTLQRDGRYKVDFEY